MRLPDEVSRAALAVDGYLTCQGQRFDALYVEVHERGLTSSASLAQSYVPGPSTCPVDGQTALVAEGDPLLGST